MLGIETKRAIDFALTEKIREKTRAKNNGDEDATADLEWYKNALKDFRAAFGAH